MSASPPFPDETKLAFDRQILAALESINDGFIVLDTFWCYTYLNRAAETMLQKKREDLLGKNIWEINPEAVGTTFWEKYHEAADTQTIVEFEDFYPPFGKWFHVRVYPSDAGLAVFFQIITEHKQLQQHLHFLFRNIGFTSGMTVPFVIEGEATGTVTFALAGGGRHYTQADLAMAEELAARASLAIHNARLYRAVQQSRDQLDIILQGVADGIIVYDKDSHIIYANEAAARMTGSPSVQAMPACISHGRSSSGIMAAWR